jgi:hypothetical protein
LIWNFAIALWVFAVLAFALGYCVGKNRRAPVETPHQAADRISTELRRDNARLTKALEEARATFARMRVAEAVEGPPGTILHRVLGEARLGLVAARTALGGEVRP